MIKNCGLLGKNISYSYSKEIHKLLNNKHYEIFDLQEKELEDFFKDTNFSFLNVTVPYKEKVIKYLDSLSSLSKRIGAVNTVIKKKGKLIGYNTDYFGFYQTLKKSKIEVKDKTVLILGNGGASKAVYAVLEDLHAKKIVVISRTGENNYQNVEEKYGKIAEIIINATPVGGENVKGSLIDVNKFKNLKAVFDLTYNPLRTELMICASKKGIFNYNGLYMLCAQAVKSVSLVKNKMPNVKTVDKVYGKLLKEKENVVLIGMTGAGKTSIGKKLSLITGKKFIDTDIEFKKEFKESTAQFLGKNSEKEFRKKETKVVKNLENVKGFIIATGGGAVLKEENRNILYKNAKIVFIKRDLNKLDIKNRPLLKNKDAKEIYNERENVYLKFSDIIVNNDRTIKKVAKIIKNKTQEKFGY